MSPKTPRKAPRKAAPAPSRERAQTLETPPRPRTPLAARSLWVTLMVALSGGATLGAEVLGARLLRPLLGTTAVAQSGVVAGVLGSLGVGAFVVAKWLESGRISLRRALLGAHLGLGLVTLTATPLAMALATPTARVLVALDVRAPWLATLLRVALAVLATVLPGLLAGALYPSAVRLLRAEAGRGTAWVGAASSIGASLAALAATFGLAPWLGVGNTMAALAGVYLAVVALGAWLLKTASPEAPEAPAAPSRRWVSEARRPLAALAAVGLASTAWQLALTRLGVLSFGPSAYALSAATAAHGMALGLGEAWAYRRLGRESTDEAQGLPWLLGVGALMAAVTVSLAMRLPAAMTAWLGRGAPSLPALWSVAFGAMVLAALPVAGVVGAALALGARHLAQAHGVRAAEANGAVLLATAAGNVIGGLGVPLVLLPRVQIEGVLAFASLALGAAAWRLGGPPFGARRGRAVTLAAAALAALVVGVRAARRDPGAVLSGPFLYAGSRELELGRVAWRRDGREATVAVRRDDVGGVLLQIDGKVDATSVGDATTQTVVGILPTVMARDPARVFVIGLGSAMTVDAVRAVPGVTAITVAELVPEVVEAARVDFARANHDVMRDPRVTVRALDAAHYLRGTRDTFDVIVSEPSNPWVAGMSDLFTREAFEAARARLAPGGVMGVWFHAYSTSDDTIASVVETFRGVFPQSCLVEVTAGTDYLLVGAQAPYALDVDRFFARAEAPAAAALLAQAGIRSRAALLARVLSGARGVARVGTGGTVYRASSLVLEFRAPALLYSDATAEVFARFARIDDLPFAGLVAAQGPGSPWLQALDESEGLREAGVHARAMVLAEREQQLDRAITEGDLAVSLSPDDLLLRTRLARLYLRRAGEKYYRRDPGGAEVDLTAVLELRSHEAERFRALVLLAGIAFQRRDAQRALARYDEAIRLAEAAGEAVPVLHARRAEVLHLLGAHDAAGAAMRAAGLR